MHHLIKAVLLGLALLLVSPAVSLARGVRHGARATTGAARLGRSSIGLSVSVGYQNVYRGSAWTPVRVVLRNGSNADISGTLQIPENGQAASLGLSPQFHGLYESPVALAAGATKSLTVYVPGAGVQGLVGVTLRQGNRTLAAASAYALGTDTGSLLVGVMAGSSADSGWIAAAIQQHVTTHVVRLDAATLDPVPEALAAFDLIALTNVDTSQLDQAQFDALQRYVHNGGSLLLVGGPTWQQTLRPLPRSLVPGQPAGSRNLPDLHGLTLLATVARPLRSETTTVSVLTRPTGTVLASQAGTPLVVRNQVGLGVVEYLAFDPALGSAERWGIASGTLEHLLAAAAPQAVARTWSPQGFRPRARRAFGSAALSNELANVPPTTLPLFVLLAVLTLIYVLLLGPANFLLLRRFRRPNLSWITIPVLGLGYLGSTVGLANQLRSNSVMLNTVGVIQLDGASAASPATFYLGVSAPLPGDYRLTYRAPALPAPIPQFGNLSNFSWRNAGTLVGSPVGFRLQEGPQTTVTFVSLKRWSSRDLSLSAGVHVAGTVRSHLTLGPHGEIAGPIHNGTNLDLLDPVLVAGQTVTHLPTIGAGATLTTGIRPSSDSAVALAQDGSSIWGHLYGGPDLGGSDGRFGGFGGFGDCCNGPTAIAEKSLIDRVRNSSATLAQVQNLSSLSQVTLAGWSEQPLAPYSLDGRTPSRRDLTLIMVPLTVHFPAHGPFQLLSGTIGARLVDLVPRAPHASCCSFFSQASQRLSVGPGGSLTFEFDTPTTGHIRFRNLSVAISGDGIASGDVYDWRAHHWVQVDLSGGSAGLHQPDRFVSPHAKLLLRLRSTSATGDIGVDDASLNVQLSGAGAVS